MAIPKRRKKAPTAKEIDKRISLSVEQASEINPKTAKPKAKPGRKPVDNKRTGRLCSPISQDTYDRLDVAVLHEKAKRHPEPVDKGTIIEQALLAWMKKNNY